MILVILFLTLIIFCRGSLAQNLYAESLVLTSATFTAAMTNLVPAITFILALSLGFSLSPSLSLGFSLSLSLSQYFAM